MAHPPCAFDTVAVMTTVEGPPMVPGDVVRGQQAGCLAGRLPQTAAERSFDSSLTSSTDDGVGRQHATMQARVVCGQQDGMTAAATLPGVGSNPSLVEQVLVGRVLEACLPTDASCVVPEASRHPVLPRPEVPPDEQPVRRATALGSERIAPPPRSRPAIVDGAATGADETPAPIDTPPAGATVTTVGDGDAARRAGLAAGFARLRQQLQAGAAEALTAPAGCRRTMRETGGAGRADPVLRQAILTPAMAASEPAGAFSAALPATPGTCGSMGAGEAQPASTASSPPKGRGRAVSLAGMLALCPAALALGSEGGGHGLPRSAREAREMAARIGRALALPGDVMAEGEGRFGPAGLLAVLAALLQRAAQVANPGGYLRTLIRRAADGRFRPSDLAETLLCRAPA